MPEITKVPLGDSTLLFIELNNYFGISREPDEVITETVDIYKGSTKVLLEDKFALPKIGCKDELINRINENETAQGLLFLVRIYGFQKMINSDELEEKDFTLKEKDFILQKTYEELTQFFSNLGFEIYRINEDTFGFLKEDNSKYKNNNLIRRFGKKIGEIKSKNYSNGIIVDFRNGISSGKWKDLYQQATNALSIGSKDDLTDRINESQVQIPKTLFLVKVSDFHEINHIATFEMRDFYLQQTYEELTQFFSNLGFEIYRINKDTFGFLRKDDSNSEIPDISKIVNEFDLKLYEIRTEYSISKLSIRFRIGFFNGVGDIYSKANIALHDPNNNFGVANKYSDDILEQEKWIGTILEALDENNENCKIIPYFQGIVDRNKLTYSCESLLRIIVGDKIYPPSFLDFDSISENPYLMRKITLAMIELVTKNEVLKNSEIKFSINFTIKDLGDEEVINYLLDNLKNNGISNDRCIIEILEQKIINEEDEENMIKLISLLRKEEIEIYMDDFGSGFSNFNRLISITLNGIKIDGTLIKDLYNPEINEEIRTKNKLTVKCIIELAHSMGFKVTAECIEDEKTFLLLLELGVDYFQGYYFYKPVPKIEIKDFQNKKD